MLTIRNQRAFTIVELLVAISITVLLLTMISQLFTNTRQAVSAGIKAGEMLVESEAIGNQLRRDAEAMLGPANSGNAGFLVIVQREIPGQIRRAGQSPHQRDDIRSDQLVFIRGGDPKRDADQIHSLTPAHQETLASNIAADHARVWYGHALRTRPDGTLPEDTSLEDGDSPNEFANAWVLGRQALLLAEDGEGNFDTGATPTPIYSEDSDPGIPNAAWEATVNNADTGGIIGSPQLFHGLTDVANQVLHNGTDGVLDSITTYPDDVYPFAIPENRPWVNPDPDSRYFEPWRVAQMHTHLSGNVSDIIVEFAGDYRDENGNPGSDGKIDRDGNGDIIWYSHYPNDPDNDDPNAPRTFVPPDFTTLSHAWYEVNATEPATADGGAIFVWEHEYDSGTGNHWPYLIRIRYRLHDMQGHIGSSTEDGERSYGRWYEHVIRVQRD